MGIQSADGIANGLQTKESYDVAGAKVELLKLQPSLVRGQSTISVSSSTSDIVNNHHQSSSTVQAESGAPEWLLRVKLVSKTEILELGVETREEALDWAKAIT